MPKKNLFVRTYMDLTVKMPITVIVIIIAGLSLLYYLTFTIKTDVYKTYIGSIKVDNNGRKYIDVSNINLNNQPDGVQAIYWYIDKQDAVYISEDFSITKKSESITLKVRVKKDDENVLAKVNNKNVYVDILAGKTSVLDRIIRKRPEEK